MHAKPTGATAVRWRQGSTPRKYATHDTYSSIFPVHKLRQTELTKDIRSKWRLWPLRPAVSCTRGGADWPKVVAVGAQQPISDFFWLYSNARHAINKRRTSPGSWSQELSSHTKINEIRHWRPKWRQFKKMVSLAGLHHSSALQRSCALPPLSTTPCSTKELSWFPPAGTGEKFLLSQFCPDTKDQVSHLLMYVRWMYQHYFYQSCANSSHHHHFFCTNVYPC